MKKQNIIAFIAGLFLVTASQSVFAQSEQPASTADSVAMLDQKVENIDTKLTTLQKIVSKLPKVSGFMQLLYTYENTEPTTSQFRVRRARVTLAGDIYKNYADYNFMVEFAGSVKLLDAYIRLTPWKQLNLQAGSFRPAFTIENMYYGATSMELIDYPQIVNKMTTLSDITGLGSGSAGRDLGMQLYGGFFNGRGFSTLQYYVGIFNGNGVDFSGINSHKDVAAMLRINPIKDLAIVGSLYWGKWAYNGAHTYADRNRWSAGFMFDNKSWFMRGEYIGGITGGLAGDNSKDANLHTDGAYLTAGVWFCNRKVAPVVRAEYYTRDTYARENTDIYYTAGVDYRPWKYLRFQVNYTAKTYTNDNPAGHQVLVMLTGMF